MHGTKDDLNHQEQYSKINTGKQVVQTVPATAKLVPAFQFSVLTCAPKLSATKTIYADGKEGRFIHAKNFRFRYCEIDSLEELVKAFVWLAPETRRCIIRGQLKPGMSGWQRRLLKPDGKDPATIECPPRRWAVFDIDGARVPAGLGAPDKMTEAGYHIRDNLLPSYFRGVQCVATATASTGLKGLVTARLRLYFALAEAFENEALWCWVESLHQKMPWIDSGVMQSQQPIYTARPNFWQCTDPVPAWGRVRLLEGFEDVLRIELPKIPKHRASCGVQPRPNLRICSEVISPELADLCEQDAGCGVHPITDTSDKAWTVIRHVFLMLKGCPTGHDEGRHKTLVKAAWVLVNLAAECELSKLMACKAYFAAAKGINNRDGKYDREAIRGPLKDALAKIHGGNNVR